MSCDRLCKQVVLEVIEEQVARGSRIYESGHFVVLVWGNSQRDLEAVERILSQARCFHPLCITFTFRSWALSSCRPEQLAIWQGAVCHMTARTVQFRRHCMQDR